MGEAVHQNGVSEGELIEFSAAPGVKLDITDEQEKFLFAWLEAVPPSIKKACKDTGIARSMTWRWRMSSDTFAHAFECVRMMIAERLVDDLLEQAHKDKYSNQWILLRIIEAWGDPKIYRPQLKVEHRGKVAVHTEIVFSTRHPDDLPV